MGLRSNYLASLDRHGTGSGVPSPEDMVEAAHRHRLVRGWLAKLGDSHSEVLRCAYELRDWPAALWDQFGRLTGIVVRLACARDVVPEGRRAQDRLEMTRAAWLAAECPRAAIDPGFARLRSDANLRLVRAHFAYSEARGADNPRASRGAR